MGSTAQGHSGGQDNMVGAASLDSLCSQAAFPLNASQPFMFILISLRTFLHFHLVYLLQQFLLEWWLNQLWVDKTGVQSPRWLLLGWPHNNTSPLSLSSLICTVFISPSVPLPSVQPLDEVKKGTYIFLLMDGLRVDRLLVQILGLCEPKWEKVSHLYLQSLPAEI